jgi:hypothetical protein
MRTLIIAAVLAAAGTAAAEINMADSIEWMTADSDTVIHGRARMYKAPVTGSIVVDIDVIKGLRGLPARTVMMRLVLDAEPAVPASWIDGKHEVIVFLERDDGGTLRPRKGEWMLGLTGDHRSQAYTADFRVLDKRDAILAAVRRSARSMATTSHRIDVPWGTPAASALYAGSSVWMTLPVDAALEKRALSWLRSDTVTTREEGARALVHFRSDATIAMLTSLMTDKGFVTVTESDKPPVRRYIVRQAADEILDGWGVAHREPVVDEPVPASPR